MPDRRPRSLRHLGLCEREEGPPTPVELDRGTGLTCDDSALACTFDLSGGGADSPVGTVSGRGGVTLTAGGAVSASAGEWIARGVYRSAPTALCGLRSGPRRSTFRWTASSRPGDLGREE